MNRAFLHLVLSAVLGTAVMFLFLSGVKEINPFLVPLLYIL